MAAKKKAPIELQLVEANNRNTFEGKDSVNSSQSHAGRNRDNLDAQINVAGLTVMTSVMRGGDLPDEPVVVLRTFEELLTFTPAEACALAAALQAVGVFLMEEEPRIITRRTEPGNPSFEETV